MKTKHLKIIVPAIIFALHLLNSFLYSESHNSNTICGHIKDRVTREPIFNVNIFLENTTLGSTSEPDGNNCLKNIPVGSYNLIIRHIGYDLVSVPVIFFETDSLTKNFNLEPLLFKGEEVQVTAAYPKEWKKKILKNSPGCSLALPGMHIKVNY